MFYFLAEKELEPNQIHIRRCLIQCKGIENEICTFLSR
ncbi:hypothetical protein ABIE05_000935 [Kosakonia cowanii]|jgi:hypothetical protein